MNPQLLDYIKNQLQAGESQLKIRNDLLANGWSAEDIEQAMPATSPENTPTPQQFSAPAGIDYTNYQASASPNRSGIIIVAIVILFMILSGTAYVFLLKPGSKQVTDPEQAMYDQAQNIAPTPKLSVPPNDSPKTTQAPVAQTKSEIATTSSTTTKKTTNPTPPSASALNSTSTQSNVQKTGNTTDLWPIYDKVAVALNNKDVSAFNAVSYKQVAPEEAPLFIQMAPFLAEIVPVKSDYVIKWQDDRQAIYATNLKREDDTNFYRYKQSVIMFVKKDGVWKVLIDSPDRGWSIMKSGTTETPAQIEQSLKALTLDSDKDGLTDKVESCTTGDSRCIKSDPNKRDTNGNGLWDGIEAEMNDN